MAILASKSNSLSATCKCFQTEKNMQHGEIGCLVERLISFISFSNFFEAVASSLFGIIVKQKADSFLLVTTQGKIELTMEIQQFTWFCRRIVMTLYL